MYLEDYRVEHISVVLIDNHIFYREGMKQVLQSDLNFNIIVDGDGQLSVSHLVKEHLPQLLLIDVTVLTDQKLNIKEDVIANSPNTKVIVIAFQDEGKYVTEALQKGAHGFLLKNMDIDSFTQAIDAVLEGMYQVDQQMSHYVVKDYIDVMEQINSHENRAEPQCPLHIYTKRECEVLQLLADGMSNRSIAEALNISEKTVKNHVSSLFRKMNVNDRTQAVITAIKNDWVNIY